MNLGEEVILTLLWQSGASESATVCFVISLSICYWLFKCVLRLEWEYSPCVCVWERERERERGREGHSGVSYLNRGLCVCVCVWERERERGSHHSGVYSPSEIVLIAACLQTHTSIITVSVTRLCSPLRLELMVKLRTLLTVYNFESWSSRLWKGALHFRRGLRCSANHNALCQLANQNNLNIKACQHILLHQIHKIMIFKKASYDPFKFSKCKSWEIKLYCDLSWIIMKHALEHKYSSCKCVSK